MLNLRRQQLLINAFQYRLVGFSAVYLLAIVVLLYSASVTSLLGQLYDEQLRVPLIVHASDGSLGPRRVEELVSHVDLTPTLLELLGARVRGDLIGSTGRSLVPLLRGRETSWEPRAAFAQRRPLDTGDGGEVYALRTASHKYVRRTEGEDELYDLLDDPGELTNVEGGGTRERMRAELEAHLARYRAHRRAFPEVEVSERFLDELRSLGYVR